MAFRDLVNGADCGPANPLQSLLKHSERDNSVQHDRMSPFGGPAGSSAMGMRTQGPLVGSSRTQEEAQRFFGPSGPGDGGAFAMEALRRELEGAARMAGGGANGPSMESAWANHQFGAVNGGGGSGSMTPQEFAHMEAPLGAAQSHPDWAQHFAANASSGPVSAGLAAPGPMAPVGYQSGAYASRPMGMGMGMYGMRSMMGYGGGAEGIGGQMYRGGPGGQPQHQSPAVEGKGKGRLVELTDANWEAEFEKIGKEGSLQNTSEAPAAEITAEYTDKLQDGAKLEGIRDVGKEETLVPDGSEADAEFMKSLEATWKNLQGTLNSSSLADSELAAWEAQYGSRFADPDYDLDFDPRAAPAPEITPETVGEFLNNPTPYPYEANNPFTSHADPFAEGQRLLAEGAPLSEVALAFEAACAQREDFAEAWRALGETHAADEKENLAIRAFEKAVGCGGPAGEAGWLALAVSWVNEGQESRALATLERWLQGSYPSALVGLPKHEPNPQNPWDRHSRVVEMFLAAARAGPHARQGEGRPGVEGHPVDADVQTGLGVLFYSNSEYDRARDCFEAALAVNPSDFLCWNRLGATLANGGSPETAIDAYRKALELRPTFTRAIYNLGVSCLNISCYQEAAEHLLAALSLHRKSGEVPGGQREKHPLLPDGDGSDNLWHTLRRAFLCMERPDLADRAKPGSDVESFRADGFDF